eukprot:CAMPEP_0196801950 /NCGR_PEP_ID=MMETSP1362-20130617/1712_1 /TAXON_ID=163516 /ORGANISM="Leptocylindrus danicus, Strain CCMP1856" /LENGTH=149 /DNA_ID=CAMNT_0042173141 /DNA_START=38 /DNA_END=487 /DNA_ORIENTATION=-
MKTRASAAIIVVITTLVAPLVDGFAPFLATSHRESIESSHYAVAKKKTATKKDTDEQEVFRKSEFVASIAEKTGMTKTASEQALAAVLDVIQEQVAAGKKISLVGFGTWKLTHRAARTGRNPKTGEPIQIQASNSPSFSASKTFKEKCN